MRQHLTYDRIHIDGFAEGSVPEEVYSDVVGRGGAGFARSDAFEVGVTGLIDQIDGRRTGRIILQHLQQVGGTKPIIIQPATLFPAGVTGTWSGNQADAYAQGQVDLRSGARGTGRGTSVAISFRIGSRAQCQFFGMPDSVLLHELVHAIRSTTGTQQYIELRSYDRFEEFVAVTLTNVYLSESRQPLRDGHGCDRMIPDVVRFRETYRPALAIVERDHTNAPLFHRIGALPPDVAPWNPFAPFAYLDLVDAHPDTVDPFVRGFLRALPNAIRAASLAGGIQSVLHRLGPNGRIGRLRILGHGNEGIQGVVHSHRPFLVGGEYIELLTDGHVRGESTLRQLTGHFGSGGWVELHGCDVAADGGALIRALAQLWHVPVKASLDAQFPGGGLEGRVCVTWPDGRYEQRQSDRTR